MANGGEDPEVLALERRSDEIKAIADAGRLDDAIAMREELFEDLEGGGESTQSLLIRNRFRHAATLQQAGRTDEALAVLERCLAMASEVPASERARVETEAYRSIGQYNAKNSDWAKAVTAADELIQRHLYTESVAESVAAVLSAKASWLGPGELDRPGEQLETVDLFLDRFAGSESDYIQAGLAWVGFMRAALLNELGRRREAIAIWGDLFDRLQRDPPSRGRAHWVPFRSQAAKVDMLLRDGQPDEAESVGQVLIEQLQLARPGQRLSDLAKAAFDIALAFDRAGMLMEAATFFAAIAERLAVSDDPELTSLAVLARINAMQMLGRLGDFDGAMQQALAVVGAGEPAIAATNRIIEEARRPGTKLERDREPWALLTQAIAFAQLGQPHEAHERLTEIINKFSQDDSPIAGQLVAAARYMHQQLPQQ
jgi:tetratricopeptide (TPR) repeat protein